MRIRLRRRRRRKRRRRRRRGRRRRMIRKKHDTENEKPKKMNRVYSTIGMCATFYRPMRIRVSWCLPMIFGKVNACPP